jgi:general stress protein 26
VNPSGAVQAAVVGIAVTDTFEIIFDTLASARKAQNIARDPRIALVIGGVLDGEERTVQYEGLADRPTGQELQPLQELYFRAFPEGRNRLSWPGLVYLRVKPQWIRYSDYRSDPPTIVELQGDQLAELR